VDDPFFSSWDEGLSTLWIPPAFSVASNMPQNDLVQPVAAAATSQVKLCPYDEEEPHIWFRLIEAQFAAAGIRSQRFKYANTLASLPKQVLRDILDTIDVCNDSDQPFDNLKEVLLGQFGKSGSLTLTYFVSPWKCKDSSLALSWGNSNSAGPGTVFLPGKEVFARPGPAAPLQPPQMRYPSHQWAPPQRLDL
jgi:hypothetical protein